MTGSSQTINVTLSAGNVSGTVSPTATSIGGQIRVEQKITGVKVYWKPLNIWAAVDENGKKLEDVPENYITVFNETMTEDQATRLEALLTEIGFTAFKTEM